MLPIVCTSTKISINRVATHLENMENLEKSGNSKYMFPDLLDFHLYRKFIFFVIVSPAIVSILIAGRTHCITLAQNCALHMVSVSAQLNIDFATFATNMDIHHVATSFSNCGR